MAFFNASHIVQEIVIHDEFTVLDVSYSSIATCDSVVFVSKAFADAHPGSECDSAHTHSITDVDGTPSDRGGFVHWDEASNRNLTDIRLYGLHNDTQDPLNVNARHYSPSGSYFLCLAHHDPSGSCDWNPGASDYVFCKTPFEPNPHSPT